MIFMLDRQLKFSMRCKYVNNVVIEVFDVKKSVLQPRLAPGHCKLVVGPWVHTGTEGNVSGEVNIKSKLSSICFDQLSCVCVFFLKKG